MKKIVLIAFVAGLSMASCKKDRTCTCTMTPVSSTVNGVGQTLNTGTHTSVTKLEKVTKKGAACNSGEVTTTDTYVSGGNSYTQIDIDKAECKLD